MHFFALSFIECKRKQVQWALQVFQAQIFMGWKILNLLLNIPRNVANMEY
jgi:hypothetical protein